MKNAACLTVSSLLVVLGGIPALAEQARPEAAKAVSGEVAPSTARGERVITVTVEQGDTLKSLSRRYLGDADRFRQVLLYNGIKNPDKIRPGLKLQIPIRSKGERFAREKAKLHRATEGRAVHPDAVDRGAKAGPKISSVNEKRGNSLPPEEQEGFLLARDAFQRGQYRKSLELIDAFLAKFPNSELTPDAMLCRADCYLALSGE